MKNITYNLALQILFAGFILCLSQYMPALGIYVELPYVEQAFLAFWCTLAFFILIIKLRDKYFVDVKIEDLSNKAKAVVYAFVATDVYFNVTFSPFFLLQYANTYGEGWTFTSHCKAIKRYSEAKVASGKRLNPVEFVRYWLCENLYGRILNLGEPGHYSEERKG